MRTGAGQRCHRLAAAYQQNRTSVHLYAAHRVFEVRQRTHIVLHKLLLLMPEVGERDRLGLTPLQGGKLTRESPSQTKCRSMIGPT
jgi:hypothetical protein